VLFDKDGTLCRSDGFLSALAQARALCCAELTGEPSITEPLLMAYGLRNGQLDPSGSTAVASRHDNLISTATVLAAAGHSWGQARQWAQAALDQADAQLAGSKAQRTPPLAGLTPVLERWHQQGLKLAVISSDLGPSLEAFLRAHGLRHLFCAVHGAERSPRKPDPAAALALCQELGVEPQRCGLIGDAADDLAMAKGAGLAWSLAFTGGWSEPLTLAGSHGSFANWAQCPTL
tara:strand:+ start:422 stop:1120 length:699 start_codon:yes stop_codon:yes gene_type:complete